MDAHAQFNGFISSIASDAAGAYLNGRVFPELDRLVHRARRARNAYMIRVSVLMMVLLTIPILLLLQHSLPQTALNLALYGIVLSAVGIGFAIVLLRLPQTAAEYRVRAAQLSSVLHDYFLRARAFEGKEDEACLKLLCSIVETML